jgi:hypothetical protein
MMISCFHSDRYGGFWEEDVPATELVTWLRRNMIIHHDRNLWIEDICVCHYAMTGTTKEEEETLHLITRSIRKLLNLPLDPIKAMIHDQTHGTQQSQQLPQPGQG